MDDEKKDEEFNLEEILNGDYTSDETFSLESILSEYKHSAFIEGERKTPPQILDEQVNKILKEASEAGQAGTEIGGESAGQPEPQKDIEYAGTPDSDNEGGGFTDNKDMKSGQSANENIVSEKDELREPQAKEKKRVNFFRKKSDREQAESSDKVEKEDIETEKKGQSNPHGQPAKEDDFDFNFDKGMFDSERETEIKSSREDFGDDDDSYFDSAEFADKIAKNIENPDWKFPEDTFNGFEDNNEKPGNDRFTQFLSRVLSGAKNLIGRFVSSGEAGENDTEAEVEEPDPDIGDEITRLGEQLSTIYLRMAAIGILCVLMLIITHGYNAGWRMPFGLGTNFSAASGIVLIMELISMMLGIDLLLKGLEDLLAVEPGVESLVLISCVITFIDGFIMTAKGGSSVGMPFSIVSVGSLFFAMWSRSMYFKATRESMRMLLASSSPYGVVNEPDIIENRQVLKKIPGRKNGFYKNLISQDISEHIFFFITPVIIILAFLLAFIASVFSGASENFAHCYAVIMSVAVAFPAASAFIMPFSMAVSQTKKVGCAIAGWNGVCDIFDSDAAIITDEDVYPVGNVSLGSVKLLEGMSQSRAITCAASLIIGSGSELSRVFLNLLKNQRLSQKKVESFTCYEGGGIGGVVDGDKVLVGSGAFMNLMGIRIPDKENIANAVFAAIGNELAAIFMINYVPANSVHSALEQLLNTRTDVLLAVKDFNVTPNSIEKKFKVSMEGVEYLPIEMSYKLSEQNENDNRRVSALLCRNGLAPLSEIINKGKSIKSITDLNTIISLAGTVIGVFLMFIFCRVGSFNSASAENAFIFMIAIEACTVLLSLLVRRRT